MNLIKWDPFTELDRMHGEINKMFEDAFKTSNVVAPAVNVYEQDNKFNVEAMLPNFTTEEVDVDITKERLEIRAEHKEESEKKTKKYIRKEAGYQSFYRSIALPKNIDIDKAKAEQKNGVLRVTIPMIELPKPKRLQISEGKEK